MSKFIYTGFGDEIDMDLSTQMNVMSQLGIRHIEMRGVNGKNISDLTANEAKEIKKELDFEGFAISAAGSPIGKIKLTDDFNAEIEKFKRTMETAHILQTDYIRIFSFYLPKDSMFDDYQDNVFEKLSAYVDAAKGSGICLLHENEKDIYGDNDTRCLKIMQEFYSDFFAVTFDPANYVQCGVDAMSAYHMLKPYIRYVHIKDSKGMKIVPSGYGDGNVEAILSNLYTSGFDGFLSIEPHLGEFEGYSALEGLGRKLEDFAPTGEGRFKIAYEALKVIVDRIIN